MKVVVLHGGGRERADALPDEVRPMLEEACPPQGRSLEILCGDLLGIDVRRF